jgi:phosphonate transport system permease protein
MTPTNQRIQALHDARPRRPFVRASGIFLGGITLASWVFGSLRTRQLFELERLGNLQRFLGELRPYPLQGREFDLGLAIGWWRETIGPKIGEAVFSTIALAVVAIALASVAGWILSLAAAQPWSWEDPYVRPARSRGRREIRWIGRQIVRGVSIFLRGVPVYVWGYLFLGTMGAGAWPAILALAIHNAGILGRLFAETLENTPPELLRDERCQGASRSRLWVSVLWPRTAPRFLVFVFYRAETCVRESTVLGLLGVVSLGWYIQDARAGQRIDEVIAYILLGSLLIVIGDALSGVVRSRVRRPDPSRHNS